MDDELSPSLLRLKLSEDKDTDLSSRFECSKCGSIFYGGGIANHKKGCKVTNYNDCFTLIGTKMIKAIKAMAKNNNKNSKYFGVSLNDLEEQLPEAI